MQRGIKAGFLLVEMLSWKPGVEVGGPAKASDRSDLATAVLSRADTSVLERIAVRAGMATRWQRACRAVDEGLTSPAEVRRTLGFSGAANEQPSPSP